MVNLKLVSSEFGDNGRIPIKYTCLGKNINPPLEISGVPEEAKSLVLIMDDPDAIKPAGKVWDHWVVWNIDVEIKLIEEDSIPGIQGRNSGGRIGYGGPCPPDGEHRYFFKLYALDKKLNLEKGSTKKEVEDAMKNSVISKTQLVGLFSKSY